MEFIVSAIVNDLLNRAVSKAIQTYRRSKAEETTEHKLRRLHRVLLRIDATVEEAEGRHITNQAMLRQLQMLRQGMYHGHHMLDTVKFRSSGGASGDDDDDLPVALPRFSSVSARRLLSFSSDDTYDVLDAKSSKRLEKTVDDLETLVGDTAEFALFLQGYPRISRQPYSAHLVVGSVMFGRQAEMETVIDFLLRPDQAPAAGNGNPGPGVLPIVGAVRMGKSTLVEHVCLDQRVRRHFSSIAVYTVTVEDLAGAGDDDDDIAAFRGNVVVKHQDLVTSRGHGGRSLAVIELAGGGDVDEESWGRLYSSAARTMGTTGSKIVITGRSEKIAALGTATKALRLKALSREAYWYVFKSLVFGSGNPGDEPALASLAMRIAELLDGYFLAGNVLASLMRANMNAHFWRRLLHRATDHTRRHLLRFGERPRHLLQKGSSVSLWRMARAHEAVTICYVERPLSDQDHVPDVTVEDLVSGRVITQEGNFCALQWRSTIPPYYTYLVEVGCASQTARCSTVNKKRPRHARE